jgi:hypothetical protein
MDDQMLTNLQQAAQSKSWSKVKAVIRRELARREELRIRRAPVDGFEVQHGIPAPAPVGPSGSNDYVGLYPLQDEVGDRELCMPRSVWQAALRLAALAGYELPFVDVRRQDCRDFTAALRRGLQSLDDADMSRFPACTFATQANREMLAKLIALVGQGRGARVRGRLAPAT